VDPDEGAVPPERARSDLRLSRRPVVAETPVRPASRRQALFASLYFVWLSRLSVALGVILRGREWLYDRSLWLDEIAITGNITSRGLRGLLQPLDAAQAAPVGWLWTERLSVDLFGVHELSLRLVPLVASLIALAAFPFLARHTLGPWAEPVATLIFATAPAMIYFAAETKQYSSDAACVVVVMLLTAAVLRRAPRMRPLVLWGAACAVLAWCSFPAIVVSAGCGLLLLGRSWRRRRAWGGLITAGVLFALSVLAEWHVTLHRLSQNHTLDLYWQAVKGFPPKDAGLRNELSWLHLAGLGVLRNPGHFAVPTLAALSAIWGFVAVLRRRIDMALLTIIPILAGVALGMTRDYPLATRLAIYLVPSMILLMAGGLAILDRAWQGLGAVLQRSVAGAVVAALAVTAGPAVATGVGKLYSPDDVTDGRGAVAYVGRHQAPGDRVLAELWAITAVDFYGPRFGVRRAGYFRFSPAVAGSCPPDPLGSLIGRRVWLVFAHHASDQPADRTEVYLSHFRAYGTVLDAHSFAGDAGAYLLDLSRPPAVAAAPIGPSWVPGGCLTVA
jgi:Dolichyl-phosphate-mannose-protein mannosyltransferase